MTLVVARIQNGHVAVVSDTQVFDKGSPLPPQAGVIKTCLLPGDLCVSFSNSPDLAARAFKQFQTEHPYGGSRSVAVKFFEESSAVTENDYILAFCNPPELATIVGGRRIANATNTAWIGDRLAYERFREYETRSRPFPQNGRAINGVMFMDEMAGSPASDLFSTMRNVILDREIPTVGGFAYSVSSRDNGFKQSVYSDVLYNWPADFGDDFQVDLNLPIDMGASGENYEYSTSQMSAGYIGVNLVAFYLIRAKKLFFFFGTENGPADRCHVFSDIQPQDIKNILRNAVGVDLNWLIFVVSSAPNRLQSQLGPRPSEGPQGIGFSMLVHENTFPKPA